MSSDFKINGIPIKDLHYNQLRRELINRKVTIDRSPTKNSLITQLEDYLRNNNNNNIDNNNNNNNNKNVNQNNNKKRSLEVDDFDHPIYMEHSNKRNIAQSRFKSVQEQEQEQQQQKDDGKKNKELFENKILETNKEIHNNTINLNKVKDNDNNDGKMKEGDNSKALEIYNLITCGINFYEIVTRMGFEDKLSFELISEYAKFMTLRILINDIDFTILQPPPLLLVFYKYHVLDSDCYNRFLSLVKVNLKNDPDKLDYIEEDDEENGKLSIRYNRTLDLYNKNFSNEINTIIWPKSWKDCLNLTFENIHGYKKNKKKEESNINNNNNQSNNQNNNQLGEHQEKKIKNQIEEYKNQIEEYKKQIKEYENQNKILQENLSKQKELQQSINNEILEKEKEFEKREKKIIDQFKTERELIEKQLIENFEKEKLEIKKLLKSHQHQHSSPFSAAESKITSTQTPIPSKPNSVQNNNNNNNNNNNSKNINESTIQSIIIMCQVEQPNKPLHTIQLKIGLETEFRKLMGFIYDRFGSGYSFFLHQKNIRILPESTPSDYGLVNGSKIDCLFKREDCNNNK